MFCCTLLYVHSSIAIILMGRRELVALLNLSSSCLVERLFLAVPRDCLRFVIVVFPDHTHLLFLYQLFIFANEIIGMKNKDVCIGNGEDLQFKKYMSDSENITQNFCYFIFNGFVFFSFVCQNKNKQVHIREKLNIISYRLHIGMIHVYPLLRDVQRIQ